MYPTLEVRWFLTGLTPAAVREWFSGLDGPFEDQPFRTDHYLRLPDAGDLGIKWREGRLELKQRQGTRGLMTFNGVAAGKVEHWRKWSFELAEAGQDLAEMLRPAEAWTAVSKARRLRRYRPGDGDEMVPVALGEFPAAGVEVELSAVQVGEAHWWSVAFESFGRESDLETGLLSTIELVLEQGEPPALPGSQSCGYPAWLQEVADQA